ncbi:MAG TPA: DUF4908 domain-containing protein [Rhizomicrobium sp.]
MRLLLAISAVLFAGTILAQAQPDSAPGMPPGMASRLAAERVSAVQPGLYSVGDASSFVLEPYSRDKYLLRFEGSTENFVLSVERGSLGAKLMKYDTGATALRVSVWGGLTLYTQDAPQGLPATRQGDAEPLGPQTVSGPELATAIGDETSHIAYVQNIALKFSADPAVMQADAETRGRAFDALTNAAIGIERFLAATPPARQVLSKRINSVKVAEGGKPTVTIAGQTLLVSFVPGEGREGHASSLAIQQELGKLFAVSTRDVAIK